MAFKIIGRKKKSWSIGLKMRDLLIKIMSKRNHSSCVCCYEEVGRISITPEKADDKIIIHAGKGRGF